MQSNPQLQLAHDFVHYTGQHIFLTGKAGTGKTTFLRQLKASSPKRMVVVAPTGVAAINAGGVTIHSFFQLSFAPQMEEEQQRREQKRFTKKKLNIIRSLDLLVIDEISMVRADVLDAIDRTLRRIRRSSKAFGGVQLLMIGDLQQLAPVVKRDEWAVLQQLYDTAFFFSSLVLKATPFVSIELRHVYRQQDERFISILNKVRDNKLDQAAAAELNKRYIPHFEVPKDSDYITLCTHNAQAKRINDEALEQLKTPKGLLRAKIEGKFPEYAYPTDEELVLKQGAQVMFVKNDPDPEKRFFNGKIGVITRLAKDEIRVQCPGDDYEIDVVPLEWENVKYTIDEKTAEIKEELEGKFTQIPLKLAWAITIHKSQGLTFNHAVIDAQSSFAHGQVYVALSRCRTLEGLVLSSKLDERSIISDATISGFVKGVEHNQPDEKVLSECKNAYQQEIINDVFDYSQVLFYLRGILRIANENEGAFPEAFLSTLDVMNVAVSEHLAQVAVKFKVQVAQLLRRHADAESNVELQERITKAAAYFARQTQSLILDKSAVFNLEIDNKAIAKQVNRYLEDLEELLKLKMRLFEVCGQGFVLHKVLDAKAKMLLQVDGKAQRKSQGEDAPSFEHLEHPKLYYELRRYRTEKAEELGRPAYFVFSQKSLAELLEYLPTDLKSLKGIKGFGMTKVKMFGPEIIEIIAAYCRDQGIDKGDTPQINFEPEAKKAKVDTKQLSYDLFKQGKTIAEVAQERQLKERTILRHLLSYVANGLLDATALLEEEKLKEMELYYAKTKNYALGQAKVRFGNKYSYDELRIGLSYYLSHQ